MISGKEKKGKPPRELWSEHKESLHSRGLSDHMISEARLFSAKESQVSEILGFNPSRSAGVVIPYLDPRNGNELIYRIRLDLAIKINGREVRYLGAKGVPNRLFFPPGWGNLLNAKAPIVFTEGEFKALVAQDAGLPTISAAGVWGWRTKNHLGQSVAISDFDLISWDDREVILALDNDIADKEPVQKAQIAIASEIYRRGAARVTALDIPYVEGAKLGIDDFLKLFGLDALQQLDTYEIPNPHPPVKIWSVSELLRAELPREKPVVEGWGFRRKAKALLVAPGGKGKTTILTQMACHLAAASPIFGYAPLAVAEPQRVALYLAEDPVSETRFRVQQQMHELGYGAEVGDQIFILDFGGWRISLENDDDRARIFQAIRECHADVAMLDPLVAIHDSDENANAAMRRVLDLLNPLIEEDVSCFIAHHEPKNVDHANGAARGASAIRDWARTMLRLTAHGHGGSTTTRFTLDLDKNNYGGSVWSVTLEREKDRYTFTVAEEKGAVSSRQVWEIVGPEERWLSEVIGDIREKFNNVSERTAMRAIYKAEEQKLVVLGERENPETGRTKKIIARGKGPSTDEE